MIRRVATICYAALCASGIATGHAQHMLLPTPFICGLSSTFRAAMVLNRSPVGLAQTLSRLDPATQPITLRLARLWVLQRVEPCGESAMTAALERWLRARLFGLVARSELDLFAHEWNAMVLARNQERANLPWPAAVIEPLSPYFEAVRSRLFDRLRDSPWQAFSTLEARLLDHEPIWGRHYLAHTYAMANWASKEVYLRPPEEHNLLDLEVRWFHELAHLEYAHNHPNASDFEQESQAWTRVLAFLEYLNRTAPNSAWSEALRRRYITLRFEGPERFTRHVLIESDAE